MKTQNHHSAQSSPETKILILYDGACGLCNRVVQFVIARDPDFRFTFAALQSDYAQDQMQSFGYEQDAENLDSFVLITAGELYDRSSAGLHLLRLISYPYKLLYPFILLPTFLRDPFYDLIAKNRQRFFPAPDSCQVPSPQDRLRFLDR